MLRENADPGGALFILPGVLLTTMWVTFISFLSNYFLDTLWGCQRSKSRAPHPARRWQERSLARALPLKCYQGWRLFSNSSFSLSGVLLRSREGRIFGWRCWELLGSTWPQPSSTEVPVPRQRCLALLNWAFVFTGGPHLPRSIGTTGLLKIDLLLKKNPRVQCALK